MFLQHLSLTKKPAEEKPVGWGVLQKNKLIINLRIYLNRSQKNILITSWLVKGESSLVQNEIFWESYVKYSKITRNQHLKSLRGRLAHLGKIFFFLRKKKNGNIYKRNMSQVLFNCIEYSKRRKLIN